MIWPDGRWECCRCRMIFKTAAAEKMNYAVNRIDGYEYDAGPICRQCVKKGLNLIDMTRKTK